MYYNKLHHNYTVVSTGNKSLTAALIIPRRRNPNMNISISPKNNKQRPEIQEKSSTIHILFVHTL